MKEMYNQNSARKFGWTPQWFGVDSFGKVLDEAIMEFQKEHGLEDDGLCGPSTYRRIFVKRESEISQWEPHELTPGTKKIVYDGNFFDIEWERVVLWDEPNGHKAKHYRKEIGKPREPKIFVNHWDVCLSSSICQKVLDNRGLSVHFLIDNDGTIYQTCDIQHITFHAGNTNKFAIGVEIANAYYPKYQSWYTKNGFPERPMWEGTVRGKKLKPHMGFYPIQMEALQALWKAVANACDIPLRCPIKDGKMLDCLYEPAAKGKWKGFVHHFHVSNKKIDCGGLDMIEYLGC
jgi:hypothetical protein